MRFKQFKYDEEYEISSPSDKCANCLFQCVVVLKDLKKIDISCKHPKGPGKPEHCIYYKEKKADEPLKKEKMLIR